MWEILGYMFNFVKQVNAKLMAALGLAKKSPSLEEQLEILAECGIQTLPGVKIENFLVSWARDMFQKRSFSDGFGRTWRRNRRTSVGTSVF